jgi:dTDP-4-dehydrorhamnose reductase
MECNGILLTGANGQVGGELKRLLTGFGEVHAPLRSELDLADEASVRAAIRRLRPRWIVNPGAYTAVDKAESEPKLAFAVNATAVQAIGEEAAALGAAVLHFSTDYVFSGEGTKAYVETDLTGPEGVYGASKLAGEQALAASGAAHLIFRTSWVYGAEGKNFLKTVLRVAAERDQMKIVADQHGAPTWSRDLAQMTAHVMAACEASGGTLAEAVNAVGGVYHVSGSGETTWFGFASEALKLARLAHPGVRYAELVPIPSSEYPTPAKRPLNSRMSGAKLERVFGYRMMEWQASLAAVLAELG